MSDNKAFKAELDSQIAARVALMEEPGYEFPEELGKIDWVLITVCPIVCLVLLVIGAFL